MKFIAVYQEPKDSHKLFSSSLAVLHKLALAFFRAKKNRA
jgi:hypothetical protein